MKLNFLTKLLPAIRSSVPSTDPTKVFSDIDQSGQNNLFGSIAGLRMVNGQFGFIPLDGKGNTLNLQDPGVNAQWLGLQSTNMQFWAYNFCAPLAGVIDRLGEASSNGRIKFVDEEDTPVKNPNKNPRLLRIKTLLSRPNPRQSWDDFDSEQIVLCKIFGYCPVFAVRPEGMDASFTKMLFNLNPFYAIPKFNSLYDLYDEDSSPIESWSITIFGSTYTIPSSDIILIKDGFIDSTKFSLGLPISKMAGLDYFVSNICAAMEADNVLLKKKGPLGIFSYDPKPDMAGWRPMEPDDQKDIQDDLKRYGMTWAQLQYIISKVPIKWNAMSFNVQELMTKETVRQGTDGICDRYGYPAELMSGKNATYENRNSAEKFLYQNNIIPFSYRRMECYNKYFGLNGVYIKLDYNHLPVLQEDIVKSGEARLAKSQSVQIDWTGGLITFNQAMNILGLDEVSGMDIYYPDYLVKYPSMVNTKNVSNATQTTSKN